MLLPPITIVILSWNGRQHLANFLPSVVETEYPDFKIIVIDNGSTDDSLSFLADQFPQIQTIALKENQGFAGGYNLGLQQIDDEYLVLLSSDVWVDKNWLMPLVKKMQEDDKIAVIQPKVLAYKQPEYFEHAGAAGGMMDIFGYTFCRGRVFFSVEKDENQYAETDLFWASGACFFIKKSIFDAAQGFDSSFFAHFEEIDLCWRIQNLGYRISYCPASTVYHLGGGTLAYNSPLKNFLNYRNNLLMLLKNLHVKDLLPTLLTRLLLDGCSVFYFLFQNHPRMIVSIIQAHWSFFYLFFSTLKKRSPIQKRKHKLTGFYPKSVVWQYFIKKHTSLNTLD